MYTELNGNLITLALQGEFDLIAHGCNCFCTMGAGIAVDMKTYFSCDKFLGEHSSKRGDINKLGTISYGTTYVHPNRKSVTLEVLQKIEV